MIINPRIWFSAIMMLSGIAVLLSLGMFADFMLQFLVGAALFLGGLFWLILGGGPKRKAPDMPAGTPSGETSAHGAEGAGEAGPRADVSPPILWAKAGRSK